MAFCANCGNSIEGNVKFCPKCGAPTAQPQQPVQQAAPQQYTQAAPQQPVQPAQQYTQAAPQQPYAEQYTQQTPPPAQQPIGAKIASINNTPDITGEINPQDIADNKIMAVLSYFGPLVFIPMFAAPQSKFARYHANQGLVLMIAEIAYGIIQAILTALLIAVFPWNWDYGLLGGRGIIFDILTTVLGLVWLALSIVALLGLINAATGKAKELPIIGKIKILK